MLAQEQKSGVMRLREEQDRMMISGSLDKRK